MGYFGICTKRYWKDEYVALVAHEPWKFNELFQSDVDNKRIKIRTASCMGMSSNETNLAGKFKVWSIKYLALQKNLKFTWRLTFWFQFDNSKQRLIIEE